MEDFVPKQPRKARRPWITEPTLELIEHRKALAGAGLIEDARGIDKMIRAAAREDKRNWIIAGLEIKFWDPIKEVTRKPQPRVVALVPAKGGGKEAQSMGSQKPAQTYADYLRTTQWGAGERTGPEQIEWGNAPLGNGAGANVNSEPITKAELENAIRQSARKKAPGLDDIPTEFWDAIGHGGRDALLGLFQAIWDEEQIPEQWREALVIGIFKKGSADDPGNLRPISLLLSSYKIFGRILAKAPGRRARTTPPPHTVRLPKRQEHVRANVHNKKATRSSACQENQALHLVFLDWSKAFDKVDTSCLPTVLRRFNVPENDKGNRGPG